MSSALVGTTGERATTLCVQLSCFRGEKAAVLFFARCSVDFRVLFSGLCREFWYFFREEESIKISVENAPKCSAWAKSTVLFLGVFLNDLEGSLTCTSHRDVWAPAQLPHAAPRPLLAG